MPHISQLIATEIGGRLSGAEQQIRQLVAQQDERLLALEIGAQIVGQIITPGLPIGRLALEPLVQGLTQEIARVRSPRGPGPIAILNQTRALQRRGLQTVISRDPFFGNTVISTVDQAARLDEFVLQAAERRIRAQQDFSPIFRARQAVIEGLRETAVERGFAATVADVANLRGAVGRRTADSPLEFTEGDFF